jgi:hypothetical protein
MPRSEWICNTCGEGFETKGRRDGHTQRMHHRTMSVGMEHSENGKFVCQCGKNYVWPHSLRHHQRICNTIKRRENRETTIDVNDDAAMDDDEGIGSMDGNELIVRNGRKNDG